MNQQEDHSYRSLCRDIFDEYKNNQLVSHVLGNKKDEPETKVVRIDVLMILFGRAYADPLTTHSVNDLINCHNELAFRKIEWRQLGIEFLRRFIMEARNRICNSKERSKSFDKEITHVKKTIPAIAAAIASWLGANEPVSIGLATLALYLIIETTHGTFCSMTDEKVIQEIMNRIEQDNATDASKPHR